MVHGNLDSISFLLGERDLYPFDRNDNVSNVDKNSLHWLNNGVRDDTNCECLE